MSIALLLPILGRLLLNAPQAIGAVTTIIDIVRGALGGGRTELSADEAEKVSGILDELIAEGEADLADLVDEAKRELGTA